MKIKKNSKLNKAPVFCALFCFPLLGSHCLLHISTSYDSACSAHHLYAYLIYAYIVLARKTLATCMMHHCSFACAYQFNMVMDDDTTSCWSLFKLKSPPFCSQPDNIWTRRRHLPSTTCMIIDQTITASRDRQTNYQLLLPPCLQQSCMHACMRQQSKISISMHDCVACLTPHGAIFSLSHPSDLH